jgi:hypothetical protein
MSDDNDRERFHAFIKRESKIRAGATIVGLVSIVIGMGAFWYGMEEANERADKAEAALETEKDTHWTRLGEYVGRCGTEIEFLQMANEFQFCDPRQMQYSLDLCADTVNENIQLQRENLEYLQYLRSCQDMVDELIENAEKLACTDKEVLASKLFDNCSNAATGWMKEASKCNKSLPFTVDGRCNDGQIEVKFTRSNGDHDGWIWIMRDRKCE